jgi:hypothetical protein
MADGAFPRDRHLTAIAIAYKNPDLSYIADAVLPRVPVGSTTFEYTTYPLEQSYQVPSTKVGEKGQINSVELTGTRQSNFTEDFGIQIPLSANDIKTAPAGFDPREYAVSQATDLVMRDREVRVSSMLFNPAAYPADNRIDMSGVATTQWSDYVNSDPIRFIVDKLDSCPMRPNALALGHAVWNKLSMHPKVVKAANGNDGGEGRATRERVAELLEIGEVLVGSSFFNTVKPGKTPVLARAWGKHALAFYRDRSVATSGGITFGITAEYESRVAGSKDVDMGLRGGVVVRSGESVRELIVAPYAAYFFEKAIV